MAETSPGLQVLPLKGAKPNITHSRVFARYAGDIEIRRFLASVQKRLMWRDGLCALMANLNREVFPPSST